MLLDKTVTGKYDEWLAIARTDGAQVLIDKPHGWTSFDVVAKLRKITNIKKVGHCGTLDPAATGLLIVCLGKATKTISNYQNLPKRYFAVMKLGAVTDTDDTGSDERNPTEIGHLKVDDITNAAESFIGAFEQIPPKYSAKKINGKRMYSLARENIEVVAAPVTVEVYELNITSINLPFVAFETKCSKGTYIRGLARDIGFKLGVGGYLTELRRTAIGNYFAANSLTIDEFLALGNLHKSDSDAINQSN